jgi:hypothetical protein
MRLEELSLKWEKEHIAYMKEWDEDRMTPSSFHLKDGRMKQSDWRKCDDYYSNDVDSPCAI